MNFKEFIKPNAIKVILAIVLLIIGVVIGAKVSGPYGCKCHDEESCANCPQMPLILSIITYISKVMLSISK